MTMCKNQQKSQELLYNSLDIRIPQTDRICFYVNPHNNCIFCFFLQKLYERDNPYLFEIIASNVDTHIEKVSVGKESLISIKSYKL